MPTNKQATYFAKACGVARLAYNWALAQWQQQYEQDKAYRDDCQARGIEADDSRLSKPSQGKLRKQLNAIKRDKYPFMLEVTKCAPQLAIMQLGDAYKRFFKGESKYPQFRKKALMTDLAYPTTNLASKTMTSGYRIWAGSRCVNGCALTARYYQPQSLVAVASGLSLSQLKSLTP